MYECVYVFGHVSVDVFAYRQCSYMHVNILIDQAQISLSGTILAEQR